MTATTTIFMGLKRISTSSKINLWQKVNLPINGIPTTMKVEDWIRKHPLILYGHVYKSKKLKIRPVWLSRPAVDALKKQLEIEHSGLTQEIKDTREFRKARGTKHGYKFRGK